MKTTKTTQTMLVVMAFLAAGFLAACDGGDNGDSGGTFTPDPPKFSCSVDAECGDGLICSSGACVESTEPPAEQPPEEQPPDDGKCDADADCEDGLVCKDGACVDSKPAGPNNPPDSDGDNPASFKPINPPKVAYLPQKPGQNAKCNPNCSDKECGSDGCGGICGICGTGITCNAKDQCVAANSCIPNCANKECGSDGCGASCGTCPDSLTCDNAGICQSKPLKIEITKVIGENGQNESLNSSNYNFGDTVVLKVTDCEGPKTVSSTVARDLTKININSHEHVAFGNNTWTVAPDGTVVGALIYDHYYSNSRLKWETAISYEHSDVPFIEEVTISCVAGSTNVKFNVKPPDVSTESLKGLYASIETFHSHASKHSKVAMDFYDKNGNIVVDTKYQNVENSNMYSHHENFAFTMNQPDTAETVDKISEIAVLYNDKEFGYDWEITVSDVLATTKNLYFFSGWGPWTTEVDSGDEGHTSVEKEIFKIEDHPWQLRCNPELPVAYVEKLISLNLSLPDRENMRTCGEEDSAIKPSPF